MSRFLVVMVSGLGSIILSSVLNAVLSGSLPPGAVPLAAGLTAWSVVVAAVTLPIVERSVSVERRFGCVGGAQIGLVFALMQATRLWRLPGGMNEAALGLILVFPVAALGAVTFGALFTREERQSWFGRRPMPAASDAVPPRVS